MRKVFAIFALMSLSTSLFANNATPVANITTTNGVFTAKAGQLMSFSGSTSYDPDGGGINYYWWYVDGVIKHSGSYASSFSWNQSSVGGGATKDTYSLMLKVRDNENTTKTKTITITVLAEERNYFVTDHLGNVRATVDQSGAVIGYDDFYPYGQVMPGRSSNTANANDIYKFTGHERDAELGLDYMLARNYDPEIGRFLSVDPLYVLYPNLSPYMYVGGNPLAYIDPDGQIIVGTDGKPVTYEIDSESGNVQWSDNASEDAIRIGNAMLETNTGTEQLNEMINSNVAITLKLSNKSLENKKGNPRRGTTLYTDYVRNDDGTYTVKSAEVTIYLGSINDYMDRFSDGRHVSIMNTVDRMIGGTAGHEAVHATDPINASRSIQQSLDNMNYPDREKKPKMVEIQIIKETNQIRKSEN